VPNTKFRNFWDFGELLRVGLFLVITFCKLTDYAETF